MWLYKPPGGLDLYGTARGSLAAVVNDQVTLTPAPAFVINPGYEGVLAELWLSIAQPVFGMQLTFTLLLNGGPVQGWSGFTPPETAGASQTLPIKGPLQLQQNSVLTVIATNVNGVGAVNVQADFFGWQYTQDLRRAVFGDAVSA